MKLKSGKLELHDDAGNLVESSPTEGKVLGHNVTMFWCPFLLGAALVLVLVAGLAAVGIIAGILPETMRVWVTRVTDSQFFLAVISTLVAAFAGTSGAQFLAERTARRREALAELYSTNAAIGFAFNIANTYLAAKTPGESHLEFS